MKSKYFLLGFLAFSFLAFGTMVQMARAADYSLGVSAGDEFTWKVTKADDSLSGYGSNVGDTYSMKINGVTDSTTYWQVTFTGTDWDGSSTTSSINVMKSPTFSFPIWFCPIPVATYLANSGWGSFASDNVVEITIGALTAKYTWSTSNGVLSKIQGYDSGELTYEITLQSSIPGYEMPLILGIAAIFTVGLVLLKRKHM